ncbi:hypothetical protein BC628DRAFT_1351246 [Trametes gibbosa]|nr:hypothetical protein BC628DRAFT_1351246 [Trametes gibbosa]
MLWTIRSPRLWTLLCRPPQRSFSFTLGRRLAEGVPNPPLFRKEVAKARKTPSFTDAVRNVPIRSQIIFVLAGTAGALAVGAHMTNYELFKWWAYIVSTPQAGLWKKERPPSSEELARAKYYAFGKVYSPFCASFTLTNMAIQQLQSGLASLKTTTEQLPETMRAMVTWSYVQVFQPILNASEGKRMCWAIGAVNCAIFLAWRVPRWGAFMMRNFTHNPLSGRSYTLLTSTFSHENIFHLAFNCMALASFGAAASQQLIILTKKVEQERGALSESSPKWHLLALFISGGLFAGLVSHVAYARWTYPRMIARLKAAITSPGALRTGVSASSTGASAASEAAVSTISKAASEGSHSLGSSGAIYAMLAITALGFPDAEVTLIIPPWYPINIQSGFMALVALDIFGVLRGWTMLDHCAHLGGAAFGVFWYAYGAQIWFTIREWDLPVAYFFHGFGLKKAKETASRSSS